MDSHYASPFCCINERHIQTSLRSCVHAGISRRRIETCSNSAGTVRIVCAKFGRGPDWAKERKNCRWRAVTDQIVLPDRGFDGLFDVGAGVRSSSYGEIIVKSCLYGRFKLQKRRCAVRDRTGYFSLSFNIPRVSLASIILLEFKPSAGAQLSMKRVRSLSLTDDIPSRIADRTASIIAPRKKARLLHSPCIPSYSGIERKPYVHRGDEPGVKQDFFRRVRQTDESQNSGLSSLSLRVPEFRFERIKALRELNGHRATE
jgi:hypothetical protein